MVEHLGDRGPFQGVVLEQLADEVLRTGREEVGELQVDLGDTTVRGLVALGLERGLANQELVTQHPEAPDVDHFVVLLALDHLGRQVVERAA